MPQTPKYQVLTATAGNDNAFPVTTLNIWVEEVDIFILDQGAYEGNVSDQIIPFNADDIHTVKGPVNLKDFFFKNQNAGANTRIILAGTQLSDAQLRIRGLIQ